MRFRLSLLFAMLPVAAFTGVELNSPKPANDVRYVVAAEEGVALDNLRTDLETRGVETTAKLEDLHALEVMASPAEAGTLAAVDGVRYAERVVTFAVTDTPGDPLYGQQSSYLQRVGAPAAWNIEKGRPNIIVAVVDTGVDVRHPDLAPNIWFNPREVANNNYDDDGNGCVDDINGCAFVSDSSPGCQNITNGFIHDDIGHGTFVSGIIGAVNNTIGMVGVARGVRIMPVKALDCYGSGDSIAVARGILYAARNGARVINLSLGGLEDAQVMRDAVVQALAAGADVHAWSANALHNQPLHAAMAGSADLRILTALLAKGADVNAVEHGGYTPLHLAAGRGELALLNVLLAHGASAEAATDDGKTAEAIARERGHLLAARRLRGELP